ncbi:MAG: hypothetical protein HOP12_10360 [Candidatus Eisenbacteria bacterium]|uniref:Uncharacterized protein n=1 Tax=Eiseniibacteriota bacterium TaxID=2212470 RepID=A0A849ST51_UNCEI|nr:hypothetical protein [Candidatus Eisenbacteria bacterium]
MLAPASSLGTRFVRTRVRLAWPFSPWFVPFAAAFALFERWRFIRDKVAAGPESPLDPAALAWMATTTHALGVLAGSALLVVAWRALGERMPYWRIAGITCALSLLTGFADLLRVRSAELEGAWRMAAVTLGGIGGLESVRADDAGLAAAFAGLGVLEAVRLILLGWAQSHAVARPFATGVAVTLSLWLAIRLATWFTLDLLAGRSGFGGL